MGKSKIEWTDRVWNVVTGCTKISPGCDNCYAYSMSKRFCKEWGLSADNPFKVTLHPDRLEQPLRWRKPSKIFVCSMSDLFHDDVHFEYIAKVFDVMERAKQHTFIVLTKRPYRMKQFIEWMDGPHFDGKFKLPNNIWLGVTAENQEQADKRIPIMLQIPAAVRFVSVEPMLGPVDVDKHFTKYELYRAVGHKPDIRRHGLDWVINGGESGPGARPMHPEWARSLRDQCQAAGVPFFFKQHGEWTSDLTNYVGSPLRPEQTHWIWLDGIHKQVGCGEVSPGNCLVYRIGKKAAGSLLDGKEWKQFPEVGA